MNYLKEHIVGLKVASAKKFNESLMVIFASGQSLNVINPYSISDQNLTELVGTTVESVDDDPSQFSIVFSSGTMLKIGIGAEDYVNGPEAFVFTTPGGPIMVQRLGDV